ncbi:MAG: SagB/ThcOx family dehydrogenase [Verrucomicrobiota bacterium]
MRSVMRTLGLAAGIAAAAVLSGAQELQDIALPAPNMEGGRPLMQVLRDRKTSRTFNAKPLPLQMLSDLLWAGAGINRPDSGKRTAPSAMNWQEIEVYAVLESGAYLYDAKANSLKAVAAGDLRKLVGGQPFVSTAPLNLVYVADESKMTRGSPEDQARYSAADTGFISQNVYLYCASEGLATVVRGGLDRAAMSAALKLPENKTIILAQTVGYP